MNHACLFRNGDLPWFTMEKFSIAGEANQFHPGAAYDKE